MFYSGYMAPEYAIDGHFSVKSDVFSFGILMLEIVSGKRNRGTCINKNDSLNLIRHVSTVSSEYQFPLNIYPQSNLTKPVSNCLIGMGVVERRKAVGGNR